MGELELIAAIQAALAPQPARVLTGPGDDASVVRADSVVAVSTDTVVDGVHFSLSTHSPADVGHKALATALSDIAAMGAGPGEAYVALVLPAGFEGALEVVGGMRELAARHGVALAGGDVVSGPVLAVTVTVTGWSGAADRLVYRSGARPGDLLGVTGELGGSGAGLSLLSSGGSASEALIQRHLRPEPRLATGLALAAAGVTSMIDVSDGVATDAGHLAAASEVLIEVRLADLPVAAGVDSPEFAATAGDDYELLFTAPQELRERIEGAAGLPVSWLGGVSAGEGLVLLGEHDEPVELRGYEHA